MSIATSATQPAAAPRSYLPDADRQALLREGGANLVYAAEFQEADCAGDEETAWAWLRFVELPAHSLMGLKNRLGAQFIRDKGLNTAPADAVYGAGWLDRD